MVSGLNQTFIESAMTGFSTIIPVLKSFSYAFENKTSNIGDTIRVPYLTNTSASADFSYATGYTTDSNVVSAKDITLSKNSYQLLKIDDAAASKLTPESMAKLGVGLGQSLARDVIQGIFAAVVTETNFPTSASITQTNLTASSGLVALVSQSDGRNWSNNRSLILDSSAWSSLLRNDNISQAFAFGGSQPIQQGVIPSVFGYQANKYTGVFPTFAQAIQGLVMDTSAIIVGLGVHTPPAKAVGTALMEVNQVTDPSGLTVQVKQIYEPMKATTYYILECLWGAQVGNSTGLVVLK